MRTRSKGTTTDKARQWRDQIQGWQQSGLSQRNYCREHGLSVSTFQLWRRRLQTGASSKALEIVAVPVAQPAFRPGAAPGGSPIVVVIGGGQYRVELREGFSSAAFQETLNVLEVR